MTRTPIWTLETIQQGIERFLDERGRYPTAHDFDECPYLPSARQIQRRFDGLETLRTHLGIQEANYTKGELRRASYHEFSARALSAEDALEVQLINHFGELFVHTQKRYYKLMKNRWDFFVYYRHGYFGVDVFTTSRKATIMSNIRHKLLKYADVPSDTEIFFVIDAPDITEAMVTESIRGAAGLKKHPNIHVMLVPRFLSHITAYAPLDKPVDAQLVLTKEQEQK